MNFVMLVVCSLMSVSNGQFVVDVYCRSQTEIGPFALLPRQLDPSLGLLQLRQEIDTVISVLLEMIVSRDPGPTRDTIMLLLSN